MWGNTNPFCVRDYFNAKMLHSSSSNSLAKMTPRAFYYKRFQVTKRNIKKISPRLSLLVNSKAECSLLDSKSRITCCDCFTVAIKESIEGNPKKDNCSGFQNLVGT